MSDDTPTPEPLTPFTEAEIIEKARGVVTGQLLLADLNDEDWRYAMMLIIVGMDAWPENTSTIFLVPMAIHAHDHWLNGRVPGVVKKCEAVPVESCAALIDKIQEFWRALNPEIPPVPQSGP